MITTNSTPFTMPVQPACNGYGNGMWGDGSFWLILLILIIFGGWNNGGWGGYGNVGAQENYILTSDFSQLSKQISDTYNMTDRKFEGLANGMCSMGYETQGLINSVNTNILTAQNGITNAITTNGYENRLWQQGIQTQIANCCCDLKQLNGETNYNIANQANMLDRTIADKFCQTNFNAQTNTRDVIDSQNANTRAILDKLCQMESNAKDEKIAELTAKNADLRLAASQAAQNEYLVERLNPNPCPQPAYVVQPPRQVTFPTNCCGYATYGNTGCGCGNVQ